MDSGMHAMTDLDLEAMSLKELKSLQRDLAKAVASYEDRQKAEARAKLDALAKEMGYSLANFAGIAGGAKTTKARRSSGEAKYRHPENSALTWTGRGRKPKWFSDHVNAGKDPSALAI
jgi:DNA-binding protein H-NS